MLINDPDQRLSLSSILQDAELRAMLENSQAGHWSDIMWHWSDIMWHWSDIMWHEAGVMWYSCFFFIFIQSPLFSFKYKYSCVLDLIKDTLKKGHNWEDNINVFFIQRITRRLCDWIWEKARPAQLLQSLFSKLGSKFRISIKMTLWLFWIMIGMSLIFPTSHLHFSHATQDNDSSG